ncbi:hypothetical protein [Photobacterium angustum]|uniref:hypothetical protein n=1 Tax=Photobacterium angustum TaxID=661 RepID=UPI0005E3F0E0|nr:hypothetical protein [Photobacterium angustum]KJG16430.1 hypothetical protein UA33_13915 [Photobacterium angustum]KJG22544.1 hypothetical protein UA39_13725 [Photobacterium angustum]KJG29412.1 hypothetical protein UA36_14725 [Photobacterium angustum]PSW97781.1 hypothetical protein C0W79_05945 [Photobacterium angustum]PSX00205.1 hypothetical protein C0W87_19395 [Photobacterium angustum]
MKKLCVAAMVAATLLGCNVGDDVVEHGGIDVDNLSQADLQNYANITADALTVVAKAAKDCAENLPVGNSNECYIPEIQGNIDVDVAKGLIKVEKQTDRVIIHTIEAMQFTTHNAITNGEVITLSLNDKTDDDYIMTMNNSNQITFKGMLMNTAENEAKYWSTESTSPLTYQYNINEVHPYITNGSAIISGKDNQHFTWSADADGYISVSR